MQLIEKLISKKETLKESFLKSIIYRIITIALGMLVVLIATGDLVAAFSLGIATEAVQFVNYFVYEAIWTYYHDKRLKTQILMTKQVNLKFDFKLLKEISFDFSQTNTFIQEAYESTVSFFDKLLQNENLSEIHEDIQRDKNFFVLQHKNRSFA
jgi:uncharacterized membrane protein